MKVLLLCFFSFNTWVMQGEENAKPQPQQVSGVYQVLEVQKQGESYWTVFKNTQGEDAPTLVIKSASHPVSLQVNGVYELQAEVLRSSKTLMEAGQILLFFPTPQGKTPVFLLSTEQKTVSLNNVPLLRLHHPGFFIL